MTDPIAYLIIHNGQQWEDDLPVGEAELMRRIAYVPAGARIYSFSMEQVRAGRPNITMSDVTSAVIGDAYAAGVWTGWEADDLREVIVSDLYQVPELEGV